MIRKIKFGLLLGELKRGDSFIFVTDRNQHIHKILEICSATDRFMTIRNTIRENDKEGVRRCYSINRKIMKVVS